MSDTLVTTLSLNAIHTIQMHAELSRLEVEPTLPGEPARVEIDGINGENPLRVNELNGTLQLDVNWFSGEEVVSDWPMRGLFGGPPRRLRLFVPPQVRLRISSNAGRVRCTNLSGELEVRSDAGRIDVDGFTGALRIHGNAGRISGTNLAGSLQVESNAGSVQLEIAELSPGTHRVQTHIGSARIELARGMPVRLDARTSMGSARMDFPSDPASPRVLELSADLGSVRVRPSERAWAGGEPRPVQVQAIEVAQEAQATLATEDNLEQILARVATGALSPARARELLQALGHV